MAKNPMIEKMRKKAVDKAMGKGGEDEEEKGAPAAPEEKPDEGMAAAGEGEVPPQVKDALGQLPVPALKAVRAEIDSILAEKEGGEGPADDMGAGMGEAPAPPMGADMGAPMPGM